ncbi:MAG TPA: hypothetical protein VHE35_34475 [Kofleriaceae bacterium]|nr:hypothetical protein [Kofleriaceae bacterium]
MLALDSLVTDLMFKAQAALDQKTLIDALGGPEVARQRKLLDPDMLDPRMEMELSPSMPFRRRGERRLLIIDDSQPLRTDPQEPRIEVDLRPAREDLIAMCEALPVRLGRVFALGAWGDAVLVARSARDLRAICLLAWALDPTVDVDGKRRASQLGKQEFEAKIMAYEKRLEELDDEDILAAIEPPVTLERRGDLLIVDVLDADGTWDQRNSGLMEQQLAAMDRFSLLPGAPASKRKPVIAPAGAAAGKGGGAAQAAAGSGSASGSATAPAPAPAAPPPPPEPVGPPIKAVEVGGSVLLVFPAERFDLDVAAALGKRDWDTVLRRTDALPGSLRDRIQRDGAGWVAPLEFLSEVFIDGKPLSKPAFEAGARPVAGGGRALEVHFPRFGPAVLLEVPGKGRFVTSLREHADDVAALVAR